MCTTTESFTFILLNSRFSHNTGTPSYKNKTRETNHVL